MRGCSVATTVRAAREPTRRAERMRTKGLLRRFGGAVGLLLLWGCGGGVPFRGMPADEVYEIGLREMAEENWGEAEKAFEAVLTVSAFTRKAEARLNLARVLYEKGDYFLAEAEYQRVIDRFPTDTTAPHASLGVCRSRAADSPRIERDQTRTLQAETVCAQVAADYAGQVVGLQASRIRQEMYDKLAEKDYHTARFYHKRELFDSAIQYYEDVIELRPRSKWVPWALYQLMKVSEEIGYDDDVERYRARLLDSYPESEPAKIALNGGGS